MDVTEYDAKREKTKAYLKHHDLPTAQSFSTNTEAMIMEQIPEPVSAQTGYRRKPLYIRVEELEKENEELRRKLIYGVSREPFVKRIKELEKEKEELNDRWIKRFAEERYALNCEMVFSRIGFIVCGVLVVVMCFFIGGGIQ